MYISMWFWFEIYTALDDKLSKNPMVKRFISCKFHLFSSFPTPKSLYCLVHPTFMFFLFIVVVYLQRKWFLINKDVFTVATQQHPGSLLTEAMNRFYWALSLLLFCVNMIFVQPFFKLNYRGSKLLFCPGHKCWDDINSRTGGNLYIVITVILTSCGSGRRLQIGTGRIGVSCKKKPKTTREQKGRLGLLMMEPQARRVESVWEESFHGGSGGVELVSEVLGFTGSRMGTTSSCHNLSSAPRLQNCNRLVHTGFTPPHVSILPGCVSRVFTGNIFCKSKMLM